MAITFELSKNWVERQDKEKEISKYLKENYGVDDVRATLVFDNGIRTWESTRRIHKYSSDAVFVYGKRKRNWGNLLSDLSHLIKVIVPEKRKTKEEKWEDSWKTALSYLEQSGLWKEIADEIRAILSIGYDKFKEVVKINGKKWDLEYEDKEGKLALTKQIQEIDSRLVHENKYGDLYVTELWKFMCPAKIKTIYFGKHRTNKVREDLRQAIESKQEFYANEQVINYYDSRVSYSPECNKGWYSEEYRNCGNGHYYLLLDHEHALFYEDD